MRERAAGPDRDDGGFSDRSLLLDTTFEGAGRLTGDLTPQATAALRTILDSLGKKAGPEDERTQPQRNHDALEEACRRLAGQGGLPDVAGQPIHAQVHITLDQLRAMRGAADAEAAWAAGRAVPDGSLGWALDRATAEAYACDAQLVPVVSGHIDPAALAAATAELLGRHRGGPLATPLACPAGEDCPHARGGGRREPSASARRRLEDTVLRAAADVLSGPAGLAAFLRRGLLASEFPVVKSLPLDLGTPTKMVPPHLRDAVIKRDRHCVFPGCRRRPARCQVHHIVPRSKGGITALTNLALMCEFHHLIAIHRWGWQLVMHADGTVTATSPDKRKVLRGHGPPQAE